MLYVLLFIVVVAIIGGILTYLLKLYGIDAKSEIKKMIFDASKEVPINADDEFNEIYDSLRKKYENQEKSIRSLNAIIGKTEIGLVVFVLLCVLIAMFKPVVLIFSCLGLILAITLLIYRNKAIEEKQKKLKPEIVSNFVKDINEGFMFDENGEISERSYKISGFDKVFNIFKSSNYLEGYLDDTTKIILSDVDVKYEKNFDNKKTLENRFQGTFGYVNLEKRFEEKVKVLIKPEETPEELIDYKSKKFKDTFDVYANEETFRAIFDKELRSAIMGYIKNFNIKLELILEGSNLYFRFYNNDLINYKKFGSNEEKESLWKYYCMIQLIYVIVDKINNI